ncbi:hypothetical protein TIFTF001_003929 [Ficus carica]|uniref:R13L1/DRL21-like LRR repeat region domain-containing protein n=1 Tax=Ficus carica TaxID=3494 RepID=A0AA87ZB55_FICCA|nr:hypothetical protein TIFTF001_003929 [Ficus carica]
MLGGCGELTHMPRGIGEMTSLQTLDMFVVADNKSSESAGLVELSKLNNHAWIFNYFYSESWRIRGSAQYLKDKENIDSLIFVWNRQEMMENAKEAFECLEPPQSIKSIHVWDYPGEIFPNWRFFAH